jgi:molybdopterin-guanine dinucleotide biosynthesis protein A
MAVDYAAVILAGGTAVRMDGVDKAAVEYAGRTLLEHALAAVSGAVEVVVVGDPVPTSRPATFVREDPPQGGPAAGLLAGRDALLAGPAYLAVLAVDMPRVSADTFQRLLAAAEGGDGAFLADSSGRRALAGVLDLAALDRVRPGEPSGLPLQRLLAPLNLAAVPGQPGEARDVDTWSDLRELREEPDA